ncbi:MAG: HU family DNA-binding protein [Marinospirillum sp.]|uniref:HU family DNA-binding protein n=1 Tax=Marinospirillum sp. TaxID=2183934 RepID=UPI0019F0D0D7|nr:HU family DNA-binding protein [Marinospirillum sp.]MBE0507933.1 HU family DNA-binding protein [Marinospirillum sp.]
MQSTQNTTLGKIKLSEQLAQQMQVSQEAAETLYDAFVSEVRSMLLKGVNVRLNGVGTIKVSHYEARLHTSPATGQPVAKPAGRRLRFTMAEPMKDALNNG